jgi:hypothetical protein
MLGVLSGQSRDGCETARAAETSAFTSRATVAHARAVAARTSRPNDVTEHVAEDAERHVDVLLESVMQWSGDDSRADASVGVQPSVEAAATR